MNFRERGHHEVCNRNRNGLSNDMAYSNGDELADGRRLML